MKILAIIPAYNEEKSIARVINQVKLYVPGADVLVVNDGSSDTTAQKARDAGARVVNLPFNLGIGAAMQTGYLYARYNNYDIAVQVDGDGQHDPAYIHDLMKPVMEGKADMVIGSRFVRKTSYIPPVARRAGMLFFSFLLMLLTNLQVKDTTSGFRVINKRTIEYFSMKYPPDYPEVDVLVKLHKKGFKILELPVEMQARKAGKSSITPIRSVYYFVKVTISLLIGSTRTFE
ncbi:MAG: glycosyltransferase family 2 protein [Clostridiaceae bacterium]|nr:glycosyltransferase family 2 protein [Clostridiaceae bacterium]